MVKESKVPVPFIELHNSGIKESNTHDIATIDVKINKVNYLSFALLEKL